MKVFIIGAGEIGRHMAIEWAQGHDVIVIERDEAVASELGVRLNGEVICGDGSSPQTLAEAGIGEADVFFAVTSNNNVNLVTCRMAHDLSRKAKTVCRVLPELERENRVYGFKEKFGIDHLFSSERLSAINLAAPILNPGNLMVENILGGRIQLQQIELQGGAEADGKTLMELKLEDRVRVGAVTRADRTFVPGGQDGLQEGDLVTLFGDPTMLQKSIGRFSQTGRKKKKQKVVVFGGDDYGSSLVDVLQNDCQIRVFEKDAAVCDKLVDRFVNTMVFHVDGSSVSELREEQVEQSDFFVACTHNDEDNVMACLQAQSLGVKNCLTLIHRSEYAAAIEKFGERFGIRKVTSPRRATEKELKRFLTADRFHTVAEIDRVGDCEVIEAVVREKSTAAGKTLSELPLPGTVIFAVVRDSDVKVPGGDDRLEAGDDIYANVEKSAKKAFLKLVTGK